MAGTCFPDALTRFSGPCAGVADFVNLVLVLAFDGALLYFWGYKSLAFLLAGVVMGGGLHPLGGHLIAEHYMFLKVGLHPARCIWGSGMPCLCFCVSPSAVLTGWCGEHTHMVSKQRDLAVEKGMGFPLHFCLPLL